MGNQFVKHPDALLEYCVDRSRWLGTDTIQDSEWSDPAGIEADNSSHTDTEFLIWIGGGTAETTYRIREQDHHGRRSHQRKTP